VELPDEPQDRALPLNEAASRLMVPALAQLRQFEAARKGEA
jgi:hypothetical protein